MGLEEKIETLDWLGQPVRCRSCPHEVMHRDGRCRKGSACVRDRRAKRVERFFGEHPSLADDYLDHPYFEVRAIATKHANLFRIPAQLADAEPEVRAMAVLRLPGERVKALAWDTDRRVRIAVASRLEGRALLAMLTDEDYYVRMIVARRLAPTQLACAINDPESEVRRWVARRIVEDRLIDMRFDPDPLVRLEVAERLMPARLAVLAEDLIFACASRQHSASSRASFTSFWRMQNPWCAKWRLSVSTSSPESRGKALTKVWRLNKSTHTDCATIGVAFPTKADRCAPVSAARHRAGATESPILSAITMFCVTGMRVAAISGRQPQGRSAMQRRRV